MDSRVGLHATRKPETNDGLAAHCDIVPCSGTMYSRLRTLLPKLMPEHTRYGLWNQCP